MAITVTAVIPSLNPAMSLLDWGSSVPERTSSYIQQPLDDADGNTESLYVFGTWEFITYGTWQGDSDFQIHSWFARIRDRSHIATQRWVSAMCPQPALNRSRATCGFVVGGQGSRDERSDGKT